MIYLLAPPPKNALTGGYIFNASVARRLPGRLRLEYVEPDALAARLERRREGDRFVLDSLYLLGPAPRSAPARLAMMLHALPSLDRAPEEAAWLDILDRLLAPSRFLAAEAIRGGFPADRVSICEPGVDSYFRGKSKRKAERTRPKRLLTVANLTPGKGYLFLLETLERLLDLSWTWNVAGSASDDPEHARSFFDRASSSGVSARLRFHGPTTRRATARLMRTCDLFVLASSSESYGMAFAEARAAGLPALGNRVGGVPEAVGSRGVLCEPGNLAEWVTALRRLLSGSGEIERLAPADGPRRGRSWKAAARDFYAALQCDARARPG